MSQATASSVTEKLREWVGRGTSIRSLEVLTCSDIRRYVDATGDANPLWLDDAFARSLGFDGRFLPPLLVGWVPFSVRQTGSGGGLDTADFGRQLPFLKDYNYTNIRNAEIEIEWFHPVYLGENLAALSCIVDIVAREGKAGLGIYITQEEQILNSKKEVICRRHYTIVALPERKFSDKTSRIEGDQ